MSEIFTGTHTRAWFTTEADKGRFKEITDLPLIRKIGYPDTVSSIFVDDWSWHAHRHIEKLDNTWFKDIWFTTDGETYRPGKECEPVMLRYDAKHCEVTVWQLHWCGTSDDPYSASYVVLSIDTENPGAWFKYSGAGTNFLCDKPFKFTGAVRDAVLMQLCEMMSAPIEVVQRQQTHHYDYRYNLSHGDDDAQDEE